MEQIGVILKERVQELQKLEQKIVHMQNDPQVMKDCLRDLLKAKKQEKIRAAKESDVLEIIFSSRSINKQQRIIFERMSYEVMQIIYPNLPVRLNHSGKLPSILELFSIFFVGIDMKQKSNEIYKIFSNSLCNKFSFICLLLNILIDTTKKRLVNFIKVEAENLSQNLGKVQTKKEQTSIYPQIQQPQHSKITQKQFLEKGRQTRNETLIEGKDSNLLINFPQNSNYYKVSKVAKGILEQNLNKKQEQIEQNQNNPYNENKDVTYNFVFENLDKISTLDPTLPLSPIKDKKLQEMKQLYSDSQKGENQSTLNSHRGNLVQLQKVIPVQSAMNQILGTSNSLSPSKKYSNMIVQRPQNHFNKQRVTSQNTTHQQQNSYTAQGNSCSTSSSVSNSVPKRHTSLKQPPNIGQIQQLASLTAQEQSVLQQNNNNNMDITVSNNLNPLKKDQLKINWNEIYTLINQQGGSFHFNIKYQNSQYNQTTRDLFGMFFPRFMEIYKTSCTAIYELDVYYPYSMKTTLKKSNTNPKDWAVMNLNNILMCMLVKNSHVKNSITQYTEQYNSFKNKKKYASNIISQPNNNNTNTFIANKSKICLSTLYSKTMNQIPQNEQNKNEPNYIKPLKRDSFRQQANSQQPKSVDMQKQSHHIKAISCNTMQNIKQTTQTMQTQKSYLNEDREVIAVAVQNSLKLPSINTQQIQEQQTQQQQQQDNNQQNENEGISNNLQMKNQDQNLLSYTFEDSAILQSNNNYLIGNSSLRMKLRHHQRSISEYRQKLNVLNNSDLNGNNLEIVERQYRIGKQNMKQNSQYQPESFVRVLNTYSNQDILLHTRDYSPTTISHRFNLTSQAEKLEYEEEKETEQRKRKEDLEYIQKIKDIQKNIQLNNISLNGNPNNINNTGYLQNLPSYRQKYNKSEMNTPLKQRMNNTNRQREYSLNSYGNQNNSSNQNINNNSTFNNINISILNSNVNESYNSSQMNKSIINSSAKKINQENIPNTNYIRQVSKFMQRSYNQPINQIEEYKMKHQQLTESILQDSYPLLHINNSKKIFQQYEHTQSSIIPNSQLYPSLTKLSMYQQI